MGIKLFFTAKINAFMVLFVVYSKNLNYYQYYNLI